MTTITGEFIQCILKKKGKPMVDGEIFLEAKEMIGEELSSNKQELEIKVKESMQTNPTGKTIVISDVTDEFLLKVLRKLGKTEIDKEVLEEIDKMIEAEIAFKR